MSSGDKVTTPREACWEWSKQDFWDHLDWDEDDHFWYFPTSEKLNMGKIVTDDEEYAKYTAWGKTRRGMRKKDLVKITHERGEIEEEG